MRSRYLLLLIYLLGSWFGETSTQSYANETCTTKETCSQVPDPTSPFLQCVGLPSTDTGRDHMQKLKGILEATMDIYTFMRSSMKNVPFFTLQGALTLRPGTDPLQNEALVQMWLDVKIKPLLKSITKQFLTCLSMKNFSCSTYQTVVMELSHLYSEMDQVRQKWIYTFFMYPFLSGDRVAGCVNPQENSEEWLMKNFGAFRVLARMKDFTTLNMVFRGLEVLHLLTPAQKAELLLRPEVAGLDNGTLTLVFHSLLTGGSGPPPTMSINGGHNWATTVNPSTTYPPQPTYSLSPQQPIREVVNGFMTAFRPIGSFVHDFVAFTHERNVSEMRITTVTQFLLNWTLAELADMYRPLQASVVSEMPMFDVTDVEDWYLQVVMPVLRRFLPNDETLMHQNITLAFHQLFYLYHDKGNETSTIQDVCSISLDNSACGLTNAVENVARILHCAALTNLTMSEATIMRLTEELTQRLNSLVMEFSTVNFSELASDFRQIFGQAESPSLTQEHLQDPNFIKLWFRVKLLPVLPDVPTALLSCLSTKNFSCPVYQTIVTDLSKHMSFMDADPMHSHNIYEHFIHSFLLKNNTSDPQCLSSANHSAEWLKANFAIFSRFATLSDFYSLNPRFAGLEVLHLLSPKQVAEMLLLPLPTPPGRDIVINQVFDFLIESPEKLPEILHHVVQLARKVDPPCGVYEHIFVRLYGAIPHLPPDMEPLTWAGIDELMSIAPDACVPENITCPVTYFNATNICKGNNSSDPKFYLKTLASMDVSCNFNLEKYACANLENFTANQLVSLLKCNLPGNSSHSKMVWKMLLTKLSFVLDPALDILDNSSIYMVGPSALEVLDVIGEIRVSLLTDEQLRNISEIRKWFFRRLNRFLPFASGRFLQCLSQRNLSCLSFQQILQVFIHHFDNMALKQQHVVLRDFVLRFLSQPHSGPGCMNGFNSSTEWLRKNLGPFSMFLSLRELQHLNPHFNPLEVLQLLTPKQCAELMVLLYPNNPDIIKMLLDYLTEPTEQKKLSDFLHHLVMFLEHQANLSCLSYKTLFERLDLATPKVSLDIVSSITSSKITLSKHIPPGCIIYRGECIITMTNETDICTGVNSTRLQLYFGNRNMKGHLCDFAVEEFACTSLSKLTAQDLAEMLMCNRSSNSNGSIPVWKLLLSKVSSVLDEALDLLSNKTMDLKNPILPIILDAIREIRLDTLSIASLNDPAIIQLWFSRRLRMFLPVASQNFLSCITTKGLNCNTYQHIVQILSHLQPHMTLQNQMSVYIHFIKVFLTSNTTAGPSCTLLSDNSGDWLQKNLGGFSVLVSFHDLQMLNSNFSAMEALPKLTVRQLAELSSIPGQLTSPAQVYTVMKYVPNQRLPAFFDDFSPAIMGHENMFLSPVRSAMLQVVFDRANLSDHSVDDSVVFLWLHNRLRPLLVNLSPLHVAPFFGILTGRNCSIEKQGVEDLNSTISSLGEDAKKEIYNHIIQSLRGPVPLRCYGDNYNHSVYSFLERSFMGFQFPNLTTFLSLMPHDTMHQLVNSMPPSDVGDFLRRPNTVDNDAQLCELYSNYIQTPVFLETESLPMEVRRPTLPCIWPMALRSSKKSDVNAWFDRRLHNYLAFLTKSLISPNITHNTTCQAFQKLILILDEHNYTSADFNRRDVFDSIRAYLTSATVPRCYNSNDPELNSTAWFAEYIGPFMLFLTLEDMQMFGSAQIIQVFTVNPLNIALLNHSTLPLNLTNYFTELIYLQDSNFNPLLLPMLCRCVVPGPAYSQLTADESMVVLYNLTTVCTDLDPQISAALAANFGDNIDATTIAALGNESTGISTGQIKKMKPKDLFASLSILSIVTGWNQGQANAIIQSLMSSGLLQFNSISSLFSLGSLIVGLPSSVFGSIGGSQLLTASTNPSFLIYLISAPAIIQQNFVTQIVSVNTNSEKIIENIPDEMASEIPRALLLGFSNSNSTIKRLNEKTWKRQQAELFFNVIAVEDATTVLGSPTNLSSSVLQGFTCTAVQNIKKVQIKKLIKACRRKGKRKVKLVETQLTCMYNYIKGESDAYSFDLYPPDMLLYYDYSLVPPASCRSYFEQLGDADFSIFSSVLDYKRTALFTNARSCLGITNTSLTKDDISVLGNMCCTLNVSYIGNSDPSILGKLKNCPSLTPAQASAVQSLLLNGKTQYGDPAMWDKQTLEDLGILPLYMTSTFYEKFDKKTKRQFYKDFRKFLRTNGVSRQQWRRLMKEIRKSNKNKSKRSLGNECTIGTITQVTISDETFPFDYDDISQFNYCLSAMTVKDNLDAITKKVDEVEYLQIVLSKLHEAYAANSTIPEDQVQLLGPASRLATVDDINKWSITQLDTLSALMDSSNGEWNTSMAKVIISKYLSTAGNKLGTMELNTIGGANLCSLDLDVLTNISPESLKNADALTVTNCTAEKKKLLFTIANQAYTGLSRSTVPVNSYQLISSYLGGATMNFIRSLSVSNVNMDMGTFISLDESVVMSLTVNEVKDLLGTHLPDLKSYENQPLVQSWVKNQFQSQLNTLGVGLTGGKADSSTTSSPAATTTTTTGISSTTTATTTVTTTGNSSRVRADAGLSALVLLALFIASQL